MSINPGRARIVRIYVEPGTVSMSFVLIVSSLLLPCLILCHLWIAPYTKVEESFNIQAVHDILTFGIPTHNVSNTLKTNYDHMSFPGAVPRTFVGALALAGLSKPLLWSSDGVDGQFVVRSILGLLNAGAILLFTFNVRRLFGAITAVWYLLLQCSQFHAIFYATRTLPNMFAFVLSTAASGLLLPHASVRNRKQYQKGLLLLTVAGIVFRSEVALLLLAYVPMLYAQKRVSFAELIRAGILGVFLGLVLTIPLDTFLWQSQHPLWPELAAFVSNVLPSEENAGASAWGTSPWYWYFVSAIPRLLMNPIAPPLAIGSIIIPATRASSITILLPSLVFVAAYSLLPHKETRFIMYIVPMLTLAAALSTTYIWNRRSKSTIFRLLTISIIASTVLSAILSHALLLPISALNYPGGHALNNLQSFADGSQPIITVHLDNLATQTGVTRFQQIVDPATSKIRSSHWIYDKSEDENAKLTPGFWDQFDYVIAEDPRRIIGAWDIVETVKGLGGVRILRPELQSSADGTDAVVRALYGDLVSVVWRRFMDRRAWSGITKGWWAEVYLDDKLYILKKTVGVKIQSSHI